MSDRRKGYIQKKSNIPLDLDRKGRRLTLASKRDLVSGGSGRRGGKSPKATMDDLPTISA